MKAYCVFCKSGLEFSVAENVNKVLDDFRAIVPTKVLLEKRRGKWEEKTSILLPGYVFSLWRKRA
ncbi:hypothetical protein Q428_11970 [Fervidicella metallireducens AeB]|uniref:NusG-like N-terminal domain-containing protein n=1 Tax=Fervidicella metallireducens AeB TaxID=1403537 RepID=A0A017RSU6_9CLOT|nr:transcription termination/antitermination NusG family protein [Fervidicella metallireducens]EYE87671.1 hypothetical protein Q428_11970 [Fervidicella metallireducens AeB]